MTINRDRKMLPEYQEYFDPEQSLGQMLVCIKQLLKEYGKDAYIEGRRADYSDSDQLSYAVYIKTPENDKQYNDRIAKEEEWAEAREKRDALEYARLQEKFGKSGVKS